MLPIFTMLFAMIRHATLMLPLTLFYAFCYAAAATCMLRAALLRVMPLLRHAITAAADFRHYADITLAAAADA